MMYHTYVYLPEETRVEDPCLKLLIHRIKNNYTLDQLALVVHIFQSDCPDGAWLKLIGSIRDGVFRQNNPVDSPALR
jgi:hypothetical protein